MQNEIFEIFNDKGRRVFYTYDKTCIPSKEQLEAMFKGGYKIKLNGVTVTKKKINELLKGEINENKN